MVKVKLCGLMTKEAVEEAVRLQVDYIGFVFAESKRRISPEQARELAALVPQSIQLVGVFLHPTLATIEEVLSVVDLDLIQIHGNWDDNCPLPRPLIRAVKASQLESVAVSEQADYLLIDADQAGSGQVFDWESVATDRLLQPFFVAGGLTPENVSQAIDYFTPYAVDVSSGIETDGKKDLQKMRAFVERTRKHVSST